MRHPCAFRDLVGQTLIGKLRRMADDPCIRHLFFEQATCGARGHGYHVVVESSPPATPWRYAVAGQDLVHELLRWCYHVAPGYSIDAAHFILLPDQER